MRNIYQLNWKLQKLLNYVSCVLLQIVDVMWR